MKIKPELLYELAVSDTELKNGCVLIEEHQPFFQQMAKKTSIGGGNDSTMLNFLDAQQVADKTIADSVEAIFGTCVKSIGIDRSFKVLQMFKILPDDGTDVTKILQQKLISPRVRANVQDNEIDLFLTNYRDLEKNIGYKFKDRAYLLQALTHPSYPTNRVTGCYQQLEFLGDAVLDFLISAFIYERCPRMDPGELTDLRSALVNNVTLACITVRNQFHLHILSQNLQLSEHIEKFVDFQIKVKHEVTEHVDLLMEEQDVICHMAEYVDVPKALGDIFEAIIAAVFLDSGNNLMVTMTFFFYFIG